MQKDGKSKNVRCVAVKIAAFSKKMQRSLFEGKGLLNVPMLDLFSLIRSNNKYLPEIKTF